MHAFVYLEVEVLTCVAFVLFTNGTRLNDVVVQELRCIFSSIVRRGNTQ